MNSLIIIIVSLAFTQCSFDRTIVQISEAEKEVLNENQHLDKKINYTLLTKKNQGKDFYFA